MAVINKPQVHLYIYLSMDLPDSFPTHWMQHKVNFSARLNSEFSYSEPSFCTMAKEPSLPYYLPTAAGREFRFIQDVNLAGHVHLLRW